MNELILAANLGTLAVVSFFFFKWLKRREERKVIQSRFRIERIRRLDKVFRNK